MKPLIAWFARNTVAANLLMLFILVSGLFTLGRLKLEVFPEISSDMISITVPYLGAAPQEVEEGVCVRIEEKIQDLDGIEEITSTAAEGVGTVLVEAEEGTDPRQLLDEIKARVDSIDTFPEETEKPVIQEVLLRFQVLSVALSGPADDGTLKHLAERIRDEMTARTDVTQVELSAVRPYEISIEVSEEALRRWGLTFDDVVNAVRRSSIDLPGGAVKTSAGEILLRTKGQAYVGEEFERLVLLARPDGTRLHLGDVATVVDGFAETDRAARFDNQPAVLLQVYRVGDQNALTIAGQVKEYLEEARLRLPEGIQMTVWQDDTKILRSRLELLLRNGRAGLLLVFLVLALFLRLRLAGWVSVGIAVSFLGAVWLMPTLDLSINVMSLFAFIVVLGIVVDDAIVVGENIYRHSEEGKAGITAAIDGAQEVAVPVTFSILTSLAAFSPLLDAPGTVGKIIAVVPLIAIATLTFSLVESLLVLPAHLSHLQPPGRRRQAKKKIVAVWKRVQGTVSSGLERFVDRAYRPTLRRALEWRYLTVALGIAFLLFTCGLVGAGWVQFVYFPDIDGENAVAYLTMPQGTPPEVTAEALERLETAARELEQQLVAEGHEQPFRHVLTTIGEQPFQARQAQATRFSLPSGVSDSHLGEVNIELAPSEEREIGGVEIARRWRELSGPIPDAVELTFTSKMMTAGEPIHVELSSQSLEELQTVARDVKAALREYPGVFDIADSFRPGKQEIKLAITQRGEALGLTLADLARQVRQAFYGEEAQRIQRGRDDIRVMVRYPRSERRSLANLEEMRIRTPDGAEIPFSTAGRAELGRGFASITRIDRRRVVSVTADLDPAVANANQIRRDLESRVLPALLADHPGVHYTFGGQQEEQRESLEGALRSWLIALLMIFALLAIPFRSYLQPLIVMSAIPFGLIGAVWGHIFMGLSLTVLSIFGLVALTGVVVNDSLVMVDFINRRVRSGMAMMTALQEAGVIRFRPILLTSLTTFAGLTPLLLERSLQAQFLIPMATSLAFGVIFATPITLVLVPVLYAILMDVKLLVASLFGRRPAEARSVAQRA